MHGSLIGTSFDDLKDFQKVVYQKAQDKAIEVAFIDSQLVVIERIWNLYREAKIEQQIIDVLLKDFCDLNQQYLQMPDITWWKNEK